MRESYKPVYSDEYQNPQIFSELETYIEFYENLSFSILSFATPGLNDILNIDTYLYRSMKSTLHSIQMVLEYGAINDAYSLLRKYYDSVTINIYLILYLEDNSTIENFIVETISDWIKGNKELPSFKEMAKYIKNSNRVSEINQLLDLDKYIKIRDRCNNHTHANSFYIMLLNINDAYVEKRVNLLDQFSHDIRNLFIFHIAYLFFIKDVYMASSDYVDSLDYGLKPEEEMKYWVSPFVQTVFDEVIGKERPDIVDKIKQNTSLNLS